eukprot:TRINITY_DN76939_c0_g1_i1.p1 TRINITY_DN76939_c0_g1~~TRINITY_DN76939_c0_g1_i1.p1  ORF type:complete len:116 (-),score=12.95 TRINITY_DN76939_c0_g1_i1:45-392(-)
MDANIFLSVFISVFFTVGKGGSLYTTKDKICSQETPCLDGEGNCNDDTQCVGNLLCGKDNCKRLGEFYPDKGNCCVATLYHIQRSSKDYLSPILFSPVPAVPDKTTGGPDMWINF